MLKRLEKTILSDRLIAPGDRLLCAVSGGADSVALLHLLVRLSSEYPFALFAAHLDHSLRPESAEDAGFVKTLCASLQIPLDSDVVDVRALSVARGEGVEAAGRFARRRFFERVAVERDCSAIALAHHADDQAETVLFRLLRGSGLTGLAAMRTRSGPYIRPLLSFRKSELTEWLREEGLAWREDGSNLDPEFSRNRIRHQVLPGLQELNPRVEEALCRFSRQAAKEEDFWREQVDAFLALHLIHEPQENVLSLPIAPLRSSHPALCRRILRGALERLRGDLRKIESGHVDQIMALLENPRPQAEACLPDVWVARRYSDLILRPDRPEIERFEQTVQLDGCSLLPGGRRLLFSRQASTAAGTESVEFCVEQLSGPLTVRSVRPGDRFQPSGMAGRKRLKDYFIDEKIPHEERRRALVVCAGDRILWLVGMRRCEGLWPLPGKPVLHMRLEPADFVDE